MTFEEDSKIRKINAETANTLRLRERVVNNFNHEIMSRVVSQYFLIDTEEGHEAHKSREDDSAILSPISVVTQGKPPAWGQTMYRPPAPHAG